MPASKFSKAGSDSGTGVNFQKSSPPFYRRPPRPSDSPLATFSHRFFRSRDFAWLALVLCLLALLSTFQFRAASNDSDSDTDFSRNDNPRSLPTREAAAGEDHAKRRGGEEAGNLKFSEFGEGEEQDEGYHKYLDDLAPFDAFNLSHPMVGAYAKLAEESLSSWTKYEGVKRGVGSRGLVQVSTIEEMGERPEWMSCGAHFRITAGKVYFRYGNSISSWYRLLRHIQTVKMIQDAVTHFKLNSLNADLIFNTCDMPLSFDSSQTSGLRSGFPVFSTQHLEGTTDILVPDPLDLQKDYMPQKGGGGAAGGADGRKKVAVFRGSSTNYLLKSRNWRANPRFRLHQMSTSRPDLVDAKLVRFSKASKEVGAAIRKDGFREAKRMSLEEMKAYSYEIVVDGGSGTCRTCGILSSDKLTIRQGSAFRQFFEPLLRPFVHYVPVDHQFKNLFARVSWAQTHESEVRKIVAAANEMAQWTCTWEGRRLFWAILLVKYQNLALEDPESVKAPEKLCQGRPIIAQDLSLPRDMPKCGTEEVEKVKQPKCSFFCSGGRIEGATWQWLEAKSLDGVKRVGPPGGVNE